MSRTGGTATVTTTTPKPRRSAIATPEALSADGKGSGTAGPNGTGITGERLFADARRLLLKGGASVADQAVFAGANFVLSVLLARWLRPADYGAFSLAYSVFTLLGTFHTSALSEPMLVFGNTYVRQFRRYVGLLTAGHLALMIPISGLLLGAAFLFGRAYSPEVQRAIVALALAGPFILLLWLLRRAFYVLLRPGWALLASGLYLAFLLGTVFALQRVLRPSPGTGFLAMGVGALPASLLLLALLRPDWRRSNTLRAADVLAGHWRYARWSIGSAALTWIPGNAYFTLLPVWLGLGGVAELRALNNLILPVVHFIGALSYLLVPLLARSRDGAEGLMARTMKVFLVLFLAGSGIYYLGLVLYRAGIVGLLYGGKYGTIVPLVPLVGLLAFFAGLTAVFGAGLRVIGRPDRIFWSYVASSAVAIGAGAPLAARLGVGGAMLGLLASSATTVTMMFVFWKRR